MNLLDELIASLTEDALVLSILKVLDEAAVLRTVRQGAPFKQVEGVKLLTSVREKEFLS